MINLAEDPDIAREKRIRAEDEKIRARTRRDAKKRAHFEQSLGGGLNSSMLEDNCTCESYGVCVFVCTLDLYVCII